MYVCIYDMFITPIMFGLIRTTNQIAACKGESCVKILNGRLCVSINKIRYSFIFWRFSDIFNPGFTVIKHRSQELGLCG